MERNLGSLEDLHLCYHSDLVHIIPFDCGLGTYNIFAKNYYEKVSNICSTSNICLFLFPIENFHNLVNYQKLVFSNW